MINIEIDGKQIAVEKGSTVMDAAKKVGVYIPHFCYHKKLSIAANCRMCLVEVEKAPKPLPACATPVAEGMKVSTHSQTAVTAQKGVMEFLLINHPLDCPICDQGGECQLQDLAVGYGESGSRYIEAKRSVTNKNLGPLISTDMTRCIHCTRCVRFGQEIAGIMELGMAGRGEHAEILTFVGKTVDSELSGNVIDLCPVGALVSKPFRYTARTWELSRRKSISPHTGLGSNLVVQVKNNRVMRVLPRENEAVNECWLSDKDRFSYEGLNSEDRLTTPMIRKSGEWQTCDWEEALTYTAEGIKDAIDQHGVKSIGALGSAHSTVEELYLLRKLMHDLGSFNIDHRIRQSDFGADAVLKGIPWLGTQIADILQQKAILVVGSTLRKDHPLLAQRMRQAAKQGMQLSVINPIDDELLIPVAHKNIVAPSAMLDAVLQVLKAASEIKNVFVPEQIASAVQQINVSKQAKEIATSLIEHSPATVFLGNLAQHHPRYTDLLQAVQALSEITGAKFGVLGEAANSVGAYFAGMVPWNVAVDNSNSKESGLNAGQMLGWSSSDAVPSCKTYILLNIEPELDCYDAQQALKTLHSAEFVVALSSYKGKIPDYADVILPISPFTETSGTFINTEGRIQSFQGVVSPRGETRPAWKILRVLGNMLQVDGFEYDSPEEVRTEVIPEEQEFISNLDNSLSTLSTIEKSNLENGVIERIGEIPIYQADPIVRRAESLQKTHDAVSPVAFASTHLLTRLGIAANEVVKIKQQNETVQLTIFADDKLPDNCVRLACAHPQTSRLGAMFGEIELEKL
ncbi:NADH-quinone oxidoreductase chain 3 [Nitrosomonas stercoris]|uniref:NADH-quinone oxidoreductase n=1 Tax=Nitrosomonas stercoris TaxID=1444684 RepID=A0A4Y1YK36_9PROT|nr:NADH-quinone oxidoreductase chain 3 [Nitrosomonas stercoris]